ncbi:MAG: sugar transporter permease [Chloroflexi bacterium]|nr:sugar transporter permease [Chloroflexota bacterium]
MIESRGKVVAWAPARRRSRPKWGQLVIGAVTVAVALIVFVPLLWMTLSSFKSVDETLTPIIRWLPSIWHVDNYTKVFGDNQFGTYFKNSVIVSCSVTLMNLVVSSLAGYGLAKFSFPGRSLVLLFFLAILMIPFQVIMIPVYIVVRQFGWINTYWGLIVPAGVSAFGVFFMRQAISILPDELFEAARLDGAGELLIYTRILLPLCSPSLAALGVLTFLGSWNNLLWPLLVVQGDTLKTLPLGLAQMATGQYGVQYNLLMTGAVISSIPVMAVFLATRSYFVRGIAVGGIK